MLQQGDDLPCSYARHLLQPEMQRVLHSDSETHALHQHGVADQANREAFNFERLTGRHDDGGEVGIFGM